MAAFTRDDPIRPLAHNLDFWIAPVTAVIQDEMRQRPVTEGDSELPTEVRIVDGSVLEGAVPSWTRMGGDVWCGQEEAAECVSRTVAQAVAEGRLRAIIEAVRSHRLDDDFSARWSFAKEDFERQLYHKRNKVSVRFVELTDTIPVQGPETEVVDRLVIADFMAVLDARNRQIVVLLSSGDTSLADIADGMGYANHSAVSNCCRRCYRASWQLPGPDSHRRAMTSSRPSMSYMLTPDLLGARISQGEGCWCAARCTTAPDPSPKASVRRQWGVEGDVGTAVAGSPTPATSAPVYSFPNGASDPLGVHAREFNKLIAS